MNSKPAVRRIVAAMLLLTAGSANAAVITRANYSGGLGGNLIGQTCSQTNYGTATGATASCGLEDTTYGTMSGFTLLSTAQPGALRVTLSNHMSSAFNTFYNSNPNANSGGNVGAYFSDTMTISAAGKTGQIGSLTAIFIVDGGATAGITGVSSGATPQDTYASISYGGNFSLGNASASFSGQESRNFSGTDVSVIADGVYQLTTSFIFGSPFAVSANFSINWSTWARRVITSFSPLAYTDSTADVLGSFGHTIYWGGITSISDNLGNPLDFSVSSESGFNYAQAAVPLPGAAWLFGSGLLGLIGASRHKRAA